MEMTSRQKDKHGLQRYGIEGGDMESLQDQRLAGSASKNEVTGIIPSWWGAIYLAATMMVKHGLVHI